MTRDEVRALDDRAINGALRDILFQDYEFLKKTCNNWFADDLNTVHHAESMLTPEQWVIYIQECINFHEIYKHNARSDFGVKAREYCINKYRAAFTPKECSDVLLHAMAGAFEMAILSSRQRAEALLMALAEGAKS
jgi:hypothetical protein